VTLVNVRRSRWLACGQGRDRLQRRAIDVVVVGEQASDGANGVVEGLVAAQVSSEAAPVLQMRDAMPDTDSSSGVSFRCTARSSVMPGIASTRFL
jgi:hypothetical protein